MSLLGYRWKLESTGQYADGHKQQDVVQYQQQIFFPRWKKLEANMRVYNVNGSEESSGDPISEAPLRRVVVWFHDESIFYDNNHWRLRWVQADEQSVPHAKGEGVSLMVADYVSANYGWL